MINFWLVSEVMGKYGYSVWMGGLPERVRSRDIEDFFKGFGKILDVSIKTKFGKAHILAWTYFRPHFRSHQRKCRYHQEYLWNFSSVHRVRRPSRCGRCGEGIGRQEAERDAGQARNVEGMQRQVPRFPAHRTRQAPGGQTICLFCFEKIIKMVLLVNSGL